MPQSVIKPGIYLHYKNKKYRVVGIAHDHETEEELVVYQQLYKSDKYLKGTLWVRPKKMFLEKVTIGGKKAPRFKYLGK